jgi:DNA-directed RNA polymerase specialized sigma24 family protein
MQARNIPIINGARGAHLDSTGLTIIRTGSNSRIRAMRTGDPKRDAILSDPEIVASMEVVIRKRGVREADVQDLLQDVLEAACEDPTLPLDDKEHARMYLCGCARFRSIDHARVRTKESRRVVDTDPDALQSPRVSAETQALANELLARGRQKFPYTHKWFERFTMEDETHAEIAADPHVSPEFVRHEVSRVRRSLRAFAFAGIAVVIGALAFRAWSPWAHSKNEPVANKVTPAPKPLPAPEVHPVPPAPSPEAVGLRDRGVKECSVGHWGECQADLEHALQLDPRVWSPEMDALLNRTFQEQSTIDAKTHRP